MPRGLRATIVTALAIVLLASQATTIAVPAKADTSSFVFSAAGDYAAYSGMSATLAQLKTTGSRFVLAVGDLSYGGIPGNATTTEQGWCDKFHRSFADVEILAGNHDVGQFPYGEGIIDNFTKYCPFTLSSPLTGVYGREYYFDFPQPNPLARFILISPDIHLDNTTPVDYHVNTTHYKWTQAAIDDARAAGIPWVIVGLHEDCISAGEHTCEIGTDIFNLLLAEKVDLILQGHEHNYERSHQLALSATSCPGIQVDTFNAGCIVHDGSDGQYVRGKGSVVVIAGTGGRALRVYNSSSPYAPYFASWMGNDTQRPQPVGSPAFGNGVATFTIDATHIAMQTHFNATYTDSFTISAPATPTADGPSPLLYVVPAAALAGIGVAGVFLWRRRKAKRPPSD